MSARKERVSLPFILVLVGFVAIPAVVLAGMLFVTGWLAITNSIGITHIRDLHEFVWGWLSIRTHKPALYLQDGTLYRPGQTIWQPRGAPWIVFIVLIATAWFLYLLVDPITWLLGSFTRLARSNG